ncbi:hypothetical protein OQA88_12941 [Cercophora sp. LCS_1]
MPALTLPSRNFRRSPQDAVDAPDQNNTPPRPNKSLSRGTGGSLTSPATTGGTLNDASPLRGSLRQRKFTSAFLNYGMPWSPSENVDVTRPAPAIVRTVPSRGSDARSGMIQGGSFRHKTFSFESPPGSPPPLEVAEPSSRKALDLCESADLGDVESGSKIAEKVDSGEESTRVDNGPANPLATDAEDVDTIIDVDPDANPASAGVRSTSSSYPSEAGGARSLELTTSPPRTFGRKIWEKLERGGFVGPEGFWSSSSSGSVRVGSKGVADRISDALDQPLSEERDKADDGPPVEANPVDVEHLRETQQLSGDLSTPVINEAPAEEPTSEFGTLIRHPISHSQHSSQESDLEEDYLNFSMECLPRVSTNLDRASVSDCDPDDDKVKPSPSKNTMSKFRHRLGHLNLNTGKVKKWFVRQFRASRKGSRVIVRKVKERKAKMRNAGGSGATSGVACKGKRSAVRNVRRKKATKSLRTLTRGSLWEMFGVPAPAGRPGMENREDVKMSE